MLLNPEKLIIFNQWVVSNEEKNVAEMQKLRVLEMGTELGTKLIPRKTRV